VIVLRIWSHCFGGTYVTIYDRILGDFPAKNTVYALYMYMVLANPRCSVSNLVQIRRVCEKGLVGRVFR